MKIYKKIGWFLLTVIFFTSAGFQACHECECPDINRIDFAEIIGVSETNSIIKNVSGSWNFYTVDTVIKRSNYMGFNIEYTGSFLDSAWENPNALATNSSTCDCSLERIQLVKVYPTSIKVFTKYKINDIIAANSSMIDYLSISMYPNAVVNTTQQIIEIDSLSLQNYQFGNYSVGDSLYYSLIEIRFTLEKINITHDSAQFVIETKFNTGQILTSETPLVRFK